MPRHLILPKNAFADVEQVLQLDEEQLRVLGELFGTSESLSSRSRDFLQKVSERLGLEMAVVPSVVLVCQFFLAVVEEGHPPDEILADIREFVELNDPTEGKELVATLDRKRAALEALLTPKPERSQALKVRYLGGIHPTATAFRTICELRPVFGGTGEEEEIVGYVPSVLLEVKQLDRDGEESRVLLAVPPGMLATLGEVIKRTEDKLAVIRRKFGDEILGDLAVGHG